MAHIATFLAGSLLSLLIPILLLMALIAWYWSFLRKVSEPTDGTEPRSTPPAADSSTSAQPEAVPAPGDS